MRAEQSRTKPSRAGQSRAEQGTADPIRTDPNRADPSRAGAKETCMFTADDGGGIGLPAPVTTAERHAQPPSRETQTPSVSLDTHSFSPCQRQSPQGSVALYFVLLFYFFLVFFLSSTSFFFPISLFSFSFCTACSGRGGMLLLR